MATITLTPESGSEERWNWEIVSGGTRLAGDTGFGSQTAAIENAVEAIAAGNSVLTGQVSIWTWKLEGVLHINLP